MRLTPPVPARPDAAVVLAGGTGRRLGGVDKAAVRVAGRTLLQSALAATAGIADVVVVGPPGAAEPPVRTVREEPARGGPAAGVLAGLRALHGASTALVLAVDMPRVTPATVARLAAALHDAGPGTDGALLHDVRRQPLCGVYQVAALLDAAPNDPADHHGLPVHVLLEGLRLVEVAALPGESRDVDTWADAADVEQGGL